MDLLRCLGLEVPIKIPQITLPEYSEKWGRQYIIDMQVNVKKIIGIHPGSASFAKNKRWPVDKYICLIEELLRIHKNTAILVFIGPDEKDVAMEIRNKIFSKSICWIS